MATPRRIQPRDDLARRLLALLEEPDNPPLKFAIILYRLGINDNTLRAVIEKKLSRSCGTIAASTRLRLAAEFWITLPMAMPTMPQFRLPLPTAPIESLPTLSPIIEQTRSFYHSRGADAFTSGSVPHHISTSAFLANEYATLIHRIHATSKSGGCAYVLDYGCGCGVLGIRVARELHRRHPTLPFCVLLADLDPSAAIAQAELPSAADLRKLGRLDVVKLDASAPLPPEGLQLLLSGRTLHP